MARPGDPVLHQIPFFSRLGPGELGVLEDITFYARFRRNQVLFIEGEPARTLYIVVKGRVKVYRASPDGREQILHLLSDGQPVAVVPFFDGGPYPATAELLEDSDIALLHFEDFQRAAEANPRILLEILRELARLAGRLLQFGRRRGEESPDGIVVDLQMSRQELGSLVGTSRETATRLLRQFQREGAIRVDGTKITILKPDVLEAWYEEV